MDTRSLLSGALLVAGLVLAFAGCDGVGTSPDEIESDTTGTSAFRPSPKDSAAISDSLKRVAPGATLTVPIDSVANEPDSTEGSGPLQFDSVSVSDEAPAEVELQNNSTEALLVADSSTTGETIEMSFRPAYGEFVSDEMGMLLVTIQEANNPPEFEETGPFSVSETASSGTEVGDVDATDGDGGDPDEGVTYQIIAGNTGGALAIGSGDGKLTVSTPSAIDFEQATSFTLTVEASDGTNQTEADVTVNVEDEAPAILDQTIGPVSEDAKQGDPVGMVESGGDQSSVMYSITSNADPDGDGTGAFAIDGSTGQVTVEDPGDLDADQFGDLDIGVEVTDGTNPAQATVTVEVSATDNAKVEE